ncbi:hypothetical protein [Lewinella cohaerens]|uniref:hypothetical protein n=1 Tax=Lewinella cohaerens TaxID=70995 RepID=UPI0012EBF0DF|nr:hypothetical protein [Lewinella cohaerens]
MSSFFSGQRFVLVIFLILGCQQLAISQSRIAVLNFRCGGGQPTFRDYLLGPTGANASDCKTLQEAVMSALYADARVQLIAHSEQEAVAAERDLQRDEDFMEGYVVDQWAVQGVEYFLTGYISIGEQKLNLTFLRATDHRPVIQEELSFNAGMWSNANERKALVLTGLQHMLTQLFPAEVQLVKVLKGSKSKARTILIAGGTKQGFRRHQELAVRTTIVENNQGEIRSRSVRIASIVVEEVESEHFSRCVIMSGGREIQEALDNGQEVFIEIL